MQIKYAAIESPPPGEAREVAPGVRWLRMPLPMALDHINLWLIEDGDGWAAVDTGLATDAIRTAWRTVLQTHRLTRQIVTHFHPDHLGLAAWLHQETGAELSMTLGEYATAQLIYHQVDGWSVASMHALFRRHGLDENRLAALMARGNVYGRAVAGIPARFRRLFAGDDVVIGGRAWRVIPGCGHAPEHVSLYCAEIGVLISGDMLLPRISTNVSAFAAAPDDDALGGFLASIERFADLPQDTLTLPAHGAPFFGMHARIGQLTAHHAERCAALRKACAQTPQSAAALIPVLFGREFEDAHQTMFAMGEAIAHLRYLEMRGALRRLVDDTESRLIRFVAA